ncbi:anaphase-promoting complex subunit Hcn1 [Rhizoclosmatium sp. JEL0117]|nr:anaphase-promoting complex subunit Hcn1 [Rhizoclosmatium sp. JEL0117]
MLTGRKVDIETPADSMRSSMAVLSGGQAAASTFILSSAITSPQSGTSLGVKWDDKDYIRAASQESRKMVSNYDDMKRAKSTSYQPETPDTAQPVISNIRRKTDATIGTDSSLNTNSSVSPSATSIGKWVSKIVLGVKDPESVPRNTVSASNLPEVYSKTVTTIGRPKNATFAGSRRTSIAGSLLQAQEDDGRQSRSPLFNIIHPVDTGDSSEFGTTHSVDMKTDNPEEHVKTQQQQQQNQWEREPSWKNVERGTPGKSIFEQAEIGSRVNDRDSGGGQRESVKSMAISSLKNNFSSGVVVSEKPIPDLPPMPQRKPAKAAKSVNKNRKKTWKDHLLFTSMFEDRGFDYFLSAEELEVNVEIGLFSTGIHTNSPAGTSAEQIAAFIFSAIGAVLYAILIGLVSSAAISYDAPGKLYRQKIDELTEYLHWKQIDNRTSKKLLDYYDFKYRGKYFEESSLLADMNESLRREISTMNCKRLIEKVPFLKRNCGDGRDDIFMGKIATALVPVFFVPGDYVFNQGERSTEMFFVLSGTVNIIVNGCIVASFDDGNFFGGILRNFVNQLLF